jgi:hypothetical protein
MTTAKNTNRTVVDFDPMTSPCFRGGYLVSAAETVDKIGVISEETYRPYYQVSPAFRLNQHELPSVPSSRPLTTGVDSTVGSEIDNLGDRIRGRLISQFRS